MAQEPNTVADGATGHIDKEAPVMFVDNLFHMAALEGVARLRFQRNNFASDAAGNTHWNRVDALVLNMPVDALRRMHDYIGTVLTSLDNE